MEKAFKIFLLLCTFSFICFSCSKEDDSDSSSFQITYTLKGPATTAKVQYTPTITDPYNIPDDYEEIVTTPWQKTVTLIDAVGAAGLSVSIDGGIAGAKYQISILAKDGTVLEDGELVLDNEGEGVLLINYYK